MSVYEESGFRFDFTAAQHSVIHDKDNPHDGNIVWPGVDFRVLEDGKQIWREVKSWSYKKILDKTERLIAHRDYRITQSFHYNCSEKRAAEIVQKPSMRELWSQTQKERPTLDAPS